MNELAKCEYITPVDIANLVTSYDINIDMSVLMAYLCRFSLSLTKIKPSVIQQMTKTIFQAEVKKRDTVLKIGRLDVKSKKYSEPIVNEPIVQELEIDRDTIVKAGEDFFVKLAKFLNDSETTILSVVHTKVYDKVLNAKEYQLLKYKHLYQQLNVYGFEVSPLQQKAIELMITPFLDKTMELTILMSLVAKNGNVEPFPASNRYINYRSK